MATPMARVLVVDDNTALAENLASILSASDLAVDVAIAPSAARALEVARERRFDVAVVDVKLPDGSGVDLVAPLREVSPHCEILMLTGAATVDGAIAALREGAGVVTTRAHARTIVTEWGVADVFGHSVRERAAALIEIAHPDFRDELRAAERSRLLERASQVDGKLTLVLTLCYLPALALLVIIPLFLTLLAGLFG